MHIDVGLYFIFITQFYLKLIFIETWYCVSFSEETLAKVYDRSLITDGRNNCVSLQGCDSMSLVSWIEVQAFHRQLNHKRRVSMYEHTKPDIQPVLVSGLASMRPWVLSPVLCEIPVIMAF